MRGLVRPLRFLASSIPLYVLWQYVLREPYLWGLAHVFAASAALFGLAVEVQQVQGTEVRFAYRGVDWSDQVGLAGLNLVGFVALVLSTTGVGATRRLRMLGLGLSALVATHLLGLWSDLVHFHLHGDPATAGFANGLREFVTGFGTFLFPLLVWLVMVRERLPFRTLGPSSDAGESAPETSSPRRGPGAQKW